MTFQRYENETNIGAEMAISAVINTCWRVQSWKPKDNPDRILTHKGKAVASVEIKQRSNAMARYCDYSIATRKLKALYRCRHPAILVVAWTDVCGYVVVSEWQWNGDKITDPRITIADKPEGTTVRGDPTDIEEMAHVPLNLFTPICIVPECLRSLNAN